MKKWFGLLIVCLLLLLIAWFFTQGTTTFQATIVGLRCNDYAGGYDFTVEQANRYKTLYRFFRKRADPDLQVGDPVEVTYMGLPTETLPVGIDVVWIKSLTPGS